MFILFGTKTKVERGGTSSEFCPYCNRRTTASILEESKWFTLFFIPVFPYSEKYFVQCNVCGLRGEIEENGELKEKS